MLKEILPSLGLLALMTHHGLSQNNNQAQAAALATEGKQLSATISVMNCIPDVIFYKDLNGVYRGGNKAWAKLAGKPLDQLLGKTDFDLFPAELAKLFRQKDKEMLVHQESSSNEEWVQYPDGRRVLLDTLKTPWLDEQGKLLGVLGISRDITGRYGENGKKADEAALQELQAANDQFYAALNAMFTGELGPMNAIWSHNDDISNQGPFGARMDGWAAVGAQFKKEAAMKLGGRIECKNLIVRVGKDLGYAVCVEEGQGMTVAGKPVKVSHRASNIFRRENGQWRLVHHHTDLASQLEGGDKE